MWAMLGMNVKYICMCTLKDTETYNCLHCGMTLTVQILYIAEDVFEAISSECYTSFNEQQNSLLSHLKDRKK